MTIAATKTMTKALQFTGEPGIDALKMQNKTLLPLGRNEVKIKIKAASLNYRDLLIINCSYHKKLSLPLTMLSDGAGEVVEIGSEVTRVKVGDRVAATFTQGWISGSVKYEYYQRSRGGPIDGMLAEYAIIHEDDAVNIPAHLSFEEASTLPCAAVTAWNALITTGRVKAGDTVLILGTGGVSLFAMQFAQMSGARVIVTSSSNEKLERVKQMGITDTINYRRFPNWEEAVLDLTNGVGADHVIEVGGAGTLERSLKAAKFGGHISLIGMLAGKQAPINIMQNLVCLQGIDVGSRQMFEEMNQAIALHKLKPIIDRVYTFNQTNEALRFMESGLHFGKIVIQVNN